MADHKNDNEINISHLDEEQRARLLMLLWKQHIAFDPFANMLTARVVITHDDCLRAVRNGSIDYLKSKKLGFDMGGDIVCPHIYNRDSCGPRFAEIYAEFMSSING